MQSQQMSRLDEAQNDDLKAERQVCSAQSDQPPPVNGPQTARTIHSSARFKYQLSYDEAFKSFLLLSPKKNIWFVRITYISLMAISACLTVLYALNPYRFEFFLLPLLSLALLGFIYYLPRLKAARGARQVQRVGGFYDVKIDSRGFLQTGNGEVVSLDGDRQARAFESIGLFVIRPDTRNSFCLPKRVMTNEQIELTRSILRDKIKFMPVEE